MTPDRQWNAHKRAAALGAVCLLGPLAALVAVEGGWYNVGATAQHWQPVHTLLEHAMHRSVRHHARAIREPGPATAQVLRRGAAVYRDACTQCHGAPGVAPAAIGQSMQPVPGPLVDAAQRWKPAELYWITRHGIKMTGMPGWGFHLADDDIWAVVAFIGALPALSPQAYAGLAPGPPPASPAAAPWTAPGDAARGRIALFQHGCNSCHRIPGVTGPQVHIGPGLEDIGARRYIAGRLPNTPDNLVLWIRNPRQVNPLGAMPDLGVTERDARDMVAYLLQK